MSKSKKKPERADEIEQATPALSERESRHYQEIRDLEATCDRLEGEYETAKVACSAAKSMWQEAVSRLRESIRRGPDPQLSLPLADDYWETDVREVITLSDRQAEALADCGIHTVEHFEAVRAGINAQYRSLTAIPGIGQATADKWENEILDWLADQRMRAADNQADDLEEDSDAVA
jgi:hypothetical protein